MVMCVNSVRVRYLGFLAGLYGRETVIEVSGVARIEDVVKLPEGYTMDDVVILVNGTPVKKGYKVKPGDVISVMPHISGGIPIP